MKCVHCQREIADGSNFCPYCGNTQSLPGNAPTTPPPPAFQTPRPQTAPPPIAGPQPVMPPPVPGAAGGPPSQRATLSMTLGIVSLVIAFVGCCPYCLTIPSLVGGGFGIAAFIMGRNELEDIAAGFASRAGESQANTAKITGIIGAVLGGLTFLGWVVIFLFAIIAESSGM